MLTPGAPPPGTAPGTMPWTRPGPKIASKSGSSQSIAPFLPPPASGRGPAEKAGAVSGQVKLAAAVAARRRAVLAARLIEQIGKFLLSRFDWNSPAPAGHLG